MWVLVLLQLCVSVKFDSIAFATTIKHSLDSPSISPCLFLFKTWNYAPNKAYLSWVKYSSSEKLLTLINFHKSFHHRCLTLLIFLIWTLYYPYKMLKMLWQLWRNYKIIWVKFSLTQKAANLLFLFRFSLLQFHEIYGDSCNTDFSLIVFITILPWPNLAWDLLRFFQIWE